MRWTAVLGWLGATRTQLAASRRWRRRALPLCFLLFLAATVNPLVQLHTAWTTANALDWANVWDALCVAGIIAFFPFLVAESSSWRLL